MMIVYYLMVYGSTLSTLLFVKSEVALQIKK